LNSYFLRGTKLPTGISSLLGYTTSVGGAPIIQIEKGEITGRSNVPLSRIVIKLSNGSQCILYSKTVLLSGKTEYNKNLPTLEKLIPELKGVHFEVTNNTKTWQIRRKVMLDKLAGNFLRNVSYNPELFPAATLKLRDPVVSVKIFANGTIIASGKDLTNIKQRVDERLKNYIGNKQLVLQVAARRNLEGKREKMRNLRYPIVNWNYNSPGYYVKPGPMNRLPRKYKIPANPALVKKKVYTNYKLAGINVPRQVRRIFGTPPNIQGVNFTNDFWNENVTGVSVSKNVSWNSNKPGYYVKPGPGGFPKWYKIPAGIKAAKKTVLKAYAGRRIPNRVLEIFKITPPKKMPSPPPPITNRSKVEGKECMRWTVKELQAIMKRRGIAYSGLRKQAMCNKLTGTRTSPDRRAAPAVNKGNFTINGVPHYIMRNTQKIKRAGREKALMSFSLANLRKFANKLGGHSSKMTKKNLVNLLTKKNNSSSSSMNSFARELEQNIVMKTPSSVATSNKSLERQLEQNIINQYHKKTANNNSSGYKRAKLLFRTNANAREFWNNYRLKGKVYPENFENMVKSFENKKLMKAMHEKGGEIM
jgi:hypothetical protein